jgi:hypothetical protein
MTRSRGGAAPCSALPASPLLRSALLGAALLGAACATTPAPAADEPPGVITDWRAAPPLGHAAHANRRNLPPGASLDFADLTVTVVALVTDSTAAVPAPAATLLLRSGAVTDRRTVPAGGAFDWHGYRIAVIAIPAPGALGGGLVALEVATVASLPDAVRGANHAGDAALRLRVPHDITHVTLHHTGSAEPLRPDDDPVRILRSLQQWSATDRNWWDVPYHFLIDLDGRVYQGRDWRYQGDTNTTYETAGHFLISVIGNYELQEPTPAQVRAVAELMAWAVARFELPLHRIGGHYDYAATSCPGVHFRGLLEDGTVRDLVAARVARVRVP